MSSWGRFFDGSAGAGGSASMSTSLSPISCPTRQHACVVEARSLDRHRLVGWSSLGKTRTMDLPAAMSAFVSRCRRGRAYVCGAYVCDFCGGADVTLNTTIQTRAETKRHREGNTSALELGGTQEVTPCVLGAGHLHWLAEVLVRVAQRLAEVLVRVPQRLEGRHLP
jgi:hypothetical protein